MKLRKFALVLIAYPALTQTQNAMAETALMERRALENKWSDSGVTMFPHRPTYFLPFAYNTNPNDAPYQAVGEPPLDNTEVKFQISFKVPLARSLFSDNTQLYFAYTQLCLWQLYNKEISSPFRDTNYEPEFFVNVNTHRSVGPLINRVLQVGAVHQSNGRADPLSRSWNRIYAQFILDRGHFAMAIKPWYRIPEPSDVDNNPDIYHYMGYGELRMAYKWKSHVFSTLLRNNLNVGNNKGAIELDWSFPFVSSLRAYLQYFNGYGECLLDYNNHNNRLGVGVTLTDWL